MGQIRRWIAFLLNAGTEHAAEPRARRRIVVNNGIAFALGGSALTYVGVILKLGFPLPALLLVLICGLYASTLWLNHLGWLRSARVLLLFVPNATLLTYFLFFGLAGEVTAFFATITLPLIVCDLKDRGTILFGVAISIGCALFMATASRHLGPGPLSAPVAHAVRVSLLLMTFVVLLAEVASFVLSNQRAERRLDQARAGVQRLLDSVDQGFVTLDPGGRIGADRSSVFDEWFGRPPAGTAFSACLAAFDGEVGVRFTSAWSQIEEDFLPLDLALQQLPGTIQAPGRTLRLAYRADLRSDGKLASVLVVASDVTVELERERLEIEQREMVRLLASFSRDRAGFAEFVAEADQLVASLSVPGEPAAMARAVHTLKGNCAIFGAQSIADRCHALESEMAARGNTELPAEGLAALIQAWRSLRARMEVFVGDALRTIVIDRDAFDDLRRQGPELSKRELLAALEDWAWEPSSKRLGRVADQLRALARQLGKGEIVVELDDGGVRLPPERFAPFWASFAHVIRNAIDHGLEAPAEREAQGRPPAKVSVRTRREGARVAIEVEDNGRGIDWQRVARKAAAQGLDTTSQSSLLAALFSDGFSTRDEVSAVSGRGVGLAAVRVACEALSGTIAVDSEPGRGTLLRCTFPLGARG